MWVITAAHPSLSQVAAREDNRLYCNQGGGQDLMDSLIMQHKQRIREGAEEGAPPPPPPPSPPPSPPPPPL